MCSNNSITKIRVFREGENKEEKIEFEVMEEVELESQ